MTALPSLTAANAYHATRLNSVWADLADEEKTAALTRAQDYLLAFYTFQPTVVLDTDTTLATATIMLAAEMTDVVALRDVKAALAQETSNLSGVGGKQSTYLRVSKDPYPQVTAALRSIITSAPGNGAHTAKLVL